VVTLDLDTGFCDRSAGSAGSLQLAEEGGQLGCGKIEATEDGNGLATASLFDRDADHLIRDADGVSVGTAWTCATIERLLADRARHRTFERRSIEESTHRYMSLAIDARAEACNRSSRPWRPVTTGKLLPG
jgi:hypothetical protein